MEFLTHSNRENVKEGQPLLQVSKDQRPEPSSYDSYIIPQQKETTTDTKDESDRPPWIVYLISGCAALNTCNVGFDIGVNSPAGMLIQEDLELRDWELEMFMGSINFFAMWGALWSSQVICRWGMKACFLLSSVLFLIGLLLMVWSLSFLEIIVGRVLVGLGVGFGFAVTPQYISETSPKQYRGFFTSWSEIGCNVGILLGFGTGFLFRRFSASAGWRLMFATGCILPSVMILFTFTVLVESPRWLVKQGRRQEGLQILRKLNPDDSDDAIQSILRDIQEDMEREQEMLHQNDTGLGWLLKKKPRAIQKMLALGLGIAISHEICGIDAIQYYLVFILQACGITSRDAQAQFLIALGGLKLACLFVASALVDKLGRRPLFLISVTGMIVSLLTIATNFFISPSTDVAADTNTTVVAINSLIGVAPTASMIMTIGGLALYLASFSVGMGPLGWILPPELVSTAIHSKAVSLTTFANRMTATFMTSTMLSIANFLSWGGYFCFLASINVTIWFLAWRFLPETKGRKLEDMSAYFQEH